MKINNLGVEQRPCERRFDKLGKIAPPLPALVYNLDAGALLGQGGALAAQHASGPLEWSPVRKQDPL